MNETASKTITPNDELEDLLRINKEMLQKEGIMYLPDMCCLKTVEVYSALFKDNMQCGDNLKNLFNNKIYLFVSSYYYRAKMRLLYEQFPIFQGLLPLVDEVLLLFFAHKYISAYIALFPAVEGLLLRWANKLKDIDNFKFRDFMKAKSQEVINNHSGDMWCKHNFKLLKFIICDFLFEHSDKCSIETMFNRNVALHLLNNPEYLQSQKNCMRLFTIIDLIANCYSYDYPLQKGGRIDNTFCYEFQEKEQEKVKKMAQEYYTIDVIANYITSQVTSNTDSML